MVTSGLLRSPILWANISSTTEARQTRELPLEPKGKPETVLPMGYRFSRRAGDS